MQRKGSWSAKSEKNKKQTKNHWDIVWWNFSIPRSNGYIYKLQDRRRSAWVALLVEHLTLDFSPGHDRRIVGLSPELGSMLSMQSAWGSLSLPLLLSPICSLFLKKKKNRKRRKTKKKKNKPNRIIKKRTKEKRTERLAYNTTCWKIMEWCSRIPRRKNCELESHICPTHPSRVRVKGGVVTMSPSLLC